jgi:ribosomal protein S18 acetylase RimI-like enzyme
MSVDVLDTVDISAQTCEIVPYWGQSRRVIVRQGERTVFACVAMPRSPSWWILDDCTPDRDDPDTAATLVWLCEHLRTAYGIEQLIAIHPEGWTDALAAAGAQSLQRMAPLGLRLEATLLGMHDRPLPDGYRTESLTGTDASALGVLSSDDDREQDVRTWQEAFAGRYGSLLPEASRTVVSDTGLRAAVAVTLHHGVPFVAHLVSSGQERGNGLGRAVLVDALLGLADAGYAECRLRVARDNVVAYRLYRSLGFTLYGSATQVSWLRGNGA